MYEPYIKTKIFSVSFKPANNLIFVIGPVLSLQKDKEADHSAVVKILFKYSSQFLVNKKILTFLFFVLGIIIVMLWKQFSNSDKVRITN